ncbi:MAG: hypothetical protein KC933_05650 [Myxococcales bacterium]|nr:hypothetical protein [Myxococcales bacterium]
MLARPRLNEAQLDALRELFNIGIGRAAGSLSMVVRQPVDLSVPEVALHHTTSLDVMGALAMEQRLKIVSQEVKGPFRGRSALIFPENGGGAVVRAMVDSDLPPEVVDELQEEALSELGNIMINACVGAMSEVLHARFDVGLPVFNLGSMQALVDAGPQDQSILLMIRIDMRLSKSNVDGFLAFMLSVDSFVELRDALDGMLQGIMQSA